MKTRGRKAGDRAKLEERGVGVGVVRRGKAGMGEGKEEKGERVKEYAVPSLSLCCSITPLV